MSLTVAYTALCTGIVVWLLLAWKFSAKSWQPQAAGVPDPAALEDERIPAARVGLWVFLAVITSLFGLFIAAFFMRMGHSSVAVDWKPFPEPLILWINTAVLLLASLAMQWARVSAARGSADDTKRALLLGGAFSLMFLIGQFLAWRLLVISGYFQPRNPAVAFFYLLTLAHGLHLLGGLYVWGRTFTRLRRFETPDGGRRELIDIRLTVELCTTYWHYLLLVWVALFALLLTHAFDSQLFFERLC